MKSNGLEDNFGVAVGLCYIIFAIVLVLKIVFFE